MKILEFIKTVNSRLRSLWDRAAQFQKYADRLLFALALAVLLGALLSVVLRYIERERASRTLVFTQWWHEELNEGFLTNLIEEFESRHNGIRVVLDTRSYDDIKSDFFSLSSFDGAPLSGDIFALDNLWVPELLAREIIENPSQAILSFINVLYYNIDILRQAGFSRPPRNRSEFTAYSRAVINTDRKGLVVDRSGSRGVYDDVFPWIWSAGASLINDGNPTVSSAPVTASLSFLLNLNNEGLILNSEGRKIEDFILGRAAFMIAPAMYIEHVRKGMGEEAFDVTLIPPPDNYAGRTFFASQDWNLALNTASQHKAEAQLFLNFLVENAPLFSEKTGASPPDRLQATIDPFYSKVWEIAMAGQLAGDFAGLPWVELDRLFGEELDELFNQTATPAQAVSVIQREWETVLRE